MVLQELTSPPQSAVMFDSELETRTATCTTRGHVLDVKPRGDGEEGTGAADGRRRRTGCLVFRLNSWEDSQSNISVTKGSILQHS